MQEQTIILDNSGADELLDALNAAPFSEQLKDLLWCELFSSASLHAGSQGVTERAYVAAVEAGDFRVSTKLGSAGIALASALRALAACSLDKEGNHRESLSRHLHKASLKVQRVAPIINGPRRKAL
jgi:hypothetical protein